MDTTTYREEADIVTPYIPLFNYVSIDKSKVLMRKKVSTFLLSLCCIFVWPFKKVVEALIGSDDFFPLFFVAASSLPH